MQKTIQDPNGSARRIYVIVGVVICCLAAILCVFKLVLWTTAGVALFCGLLILCIGLFTRPFMLLDTNGITVRYLFRKRFCPWDRVERVEIRDTKARKSSREERFPIVLLLPGGGKCRWMRELFRSVSVLNRPEIKGFIAANYGQLDLDETKDLNDWEKQYYHF